MENENFSDDCPIRRLLHRFEHTKNDCLWRSSPFVIEETDVSEFLGLTYTAHSPKSPSLDHVPGFQILSLMPAMLREVGAIPPEVPRLVNYGVDRVRFTDPVKIGQRLATTFRLAGLTWRSDQFATLNFFTEVKGLGEAKPGMVADLIVGIPIPRTSNLEMPQ